jgi:hypothetical protein
MRILRRFIKGAVFGIMGISLLTLASWNSQAQVPTRESEPKARILVGKEATPTKTGVQEQPTRQPQPLSLEEKRRFFRSVINSLAEQSKLNPNSNSAQVFSPNLWKPDFDLQALPPTLTPRRPWLDKVGWLEFSDPERIAKKDGSEEYFAYWHNSGPVPSLTVNLNAAKGTYLLDFTVNAQPQGLKVIEGAPASVSMQIPVAQGHVLVPLSAPQAGWYEITVSCPGCLGWTFYKVEIDQVK